MEKIYQTAKMILAILVFTYSSVGAEGAAENKVPISSGLNAGHPAAPLVNKPKTFKKIKAAKKTAPAAAAPAVKQVWICPMCHIKADKPGKCPECGMDMVKLPTDAKKKD